MINMPVCILLNILNVVLRTNQRSDLYQVTHSENPVLSGQTYHAGNGNSNLSSCNSMSLHQVKTDQFTEATVMD